MFRTSKKKKKKEQQQQQQQKKTQQQQQQNDISITIYYAWMPHQENIYLILGLFSGVTCIES